AAGVIQKALAAGAQVKILYLTNGEHNQLAFIVYEKRFVIKQKALIGMGELRREEAQAAMGLLGVPKDNLVFLGYPDFGALTIFFRYWGDVKPFRNMLTRISNVPYKDALTPNAPYKGEAVLWDIEAVLKRYRPTKIFVTNPVDTNRDHKASYLFLQVALWNLRGQIPEPRVYQYLIHCYAWPRPRNYHPGLYMPVPKLLERGRIRWASCDLAPSEVEKKYQAIRLYKSQCSDNAFYLTSFARKNELFGEYPVIDLAITGKGEACQEAGEFHDRAVTYGRRDKDLIINVFVRNGSGGHHRFYVTLAGHSDKIEFDQMPKLKISVDKNTVRALDRGRFIKVEGLGIEPKRHSVTIKLPLRALKDPERVLASVNTYTDNFPSDLNAWRTIKIR
ncbi:MAG: PIG-L family deacetylase, partial [Candidatus Omnitrophica bacterium]|nr:PIG-L family deacetylase [Candidatus Omnitrophota bacterium]